MTQDLKVLYVEDDEDIRNIVEFSLDGEGFSLLSCPSGEAALHAAREFHPDLILLDVMMPGMDGPTTLQKLRLLEHLAAVPVIFMTAKVQGVEVESYLEMGAIGVISKPFDPMSLPERIKEFL